MQSLEIKAQSSLSQPQSQLVGRYRLQGMSLVEDHKIIWEEVAIVLKQVFDV